MSDAPKPKRGRPSTLDIDKTLDVAMGAYWQNDPVDVSLNAICDLASVSKPALYRIFGGEDGLMRAVLDRYAEQVLSDIFKILARDAPVNETLAALIHFASQEPKMATGCVFYKMRAGKHRLGPKTRERVAEIDTAAVQAFEAYLVARSDDGDWDGDQSPAMVARYLVEQIGLALTQRAAGEDPAGIRDTLALALSVIQRP
ncbi:MAG: TetR/AcrR family transcriptional regulator [Rhodobacter sp.]|nr:TetR/AcrR family transcriptional regulator [Rhodobacter sp.]